RGDVLVAGADRHAGAGTDDVRGRSDPPERARSDRCPLRAVPVRAGRSAGDWIRAAGAPGGAEILTVRSSGLFRRGTLLIAAGIFLSVAHAQSNPHDARAREIFK